MQDITDKIGAAKALFMAGRDPGDEEVAAKVIGPALDFIGEIVANSRRIADALETIAKNTAPVELMCAESISSSFDITEDIEKIVKRMIGENEVAMKRRAY